jgi:hypothetical protein
VLVKVLVLGGVHGFNNLGIIDLETCLISDEEAERTCENRVILSREDPRRVTIQFLFLGSLNCIVALNKIAEDRDMTLAHLDRIVLLPIKL